MSVIGGWVLVPLALTVVLCGLGLLAERVAGLRLPGALVPAVGLSALVCVAGLATMADATAELAVPACAGLAVAGLVLGLRDGDPRLRAAVPWGIAVAAGAYALYAAPSLLSGQASITGYIKLDDSATWLATTDHLFSHGRHISGVVSPSSFSATLEGWLGNNYPVGSFLPLGVAGRLSGQDLANAFQPVITVVACVLALGLYAVARDLVRSRAAAAAAALVGVQASMLVGYAQWGGIKEVVSAALLVPLAALVAGAALQDGPRRLVLAALPGGALLGTLGINGAAWVGPALLAGAAAVLVAGAGPRGRSLVLVAACGALLVVVALPALTHLGFADATRSGPISNQEDLGNLVQPLPLIQAAGLYPVGDFRRQPDPRSLAALLAVLCLAGTAGAVALGVVRRRWGIPALAGIVAAGALPAIAIGAPWIDAKVFAIASGTVLTCAAAFAAAGLLARSRAGRTAGAIGGTVLVLGAAWSTLAVLRDVNVAPRDQLAELHSMAKKFPGPLVVLDSAIYANRHFLRESAAEGVTDLRVHQIPSRTGPTFDELTRAEVDDVDRNALASYNTIVRRRAPVGSRPPTAYRRVFAGKYFEAWVREPGAPVPIQHYAISSSIAPGGFPVCADMRVLSKLPGARELAFATPPQPLIVNLTATASPAQWKSEDGILPLVDGTGRLTVNVPSAGRWRIWVGGSVRGHLSVTVDGKPVGDVRHQLEWGSEWLRMDVAELSAGEHEVALTYARGGPLRAGRGNDVAQTPLGPLVLSRLEDETPAEVQRIPARDYRALCDGRVLDWVEVLP